MPARYSVGIVGFRVRRNIRSFIRRVNAARGYGKPGRASPSDNMWGRNRETSCPVPTSCDLFVLRASAAPSALMHH